MESKYLVAVFETLAKADVALEVLCKAGYGPDQVSFITRHDSPDLKNVQQLQTKTQAAADDTQVADGKHASATAPGTGFGAAIGSAVSAPIAVGSLMFPLFVAGPLVGAGFGAVLGGLFDSDKEAEDKESTYSEHVHAGACLIVVTGDDYQLREAKASLKTCGPIVIDDYKVASDD